MTKKEKELIVFQIAVEKELELYYHSAWLSTKEDYLYANYKKHRYCKRKLKELIK